VHILFSGCPGYIKSFLAYDSKDKRLWGVVHFESEEAAEQAAESRTGTTWDGTRAIRIDLGQPAWMAADGGVELKVVLRDRQQCAAAAPVRVRPELNTPAAQQAYRKLAAAVEGRKTAELKEAIAQGEAAGLADFELRQARDALSRMNTQRCVNTAAACEQRACAVMKKALAASSDPRANATPARIEELRNARRVGEEAAQVCSTAGLTRGERKLKTLSREIADRLQALEGSAPAAATPVE
jgi:hypothetical protein